MFQTTKKENRKKKRIRNSLRARVQFTLCGWHSKFNNENGVHKTANKFCGISSGEINAAFGKKKKFKEFCMFRFLNYS